MTRKACRLTNTISESPASAHPSGQTLARGHRACPLYVPIATWEIQQTTHGGRLVSHGSPFHAHLPQTSAPH